jgi:hypothetical protein
MSENVDLQRVALKLIQNSDGGSFDTFLLWAQWCRNIAAAALKQDKDMVEYLATKVETYE